MNQEQLETMRHSTAPYLAAAVQSLFPEANSAWGPAVENGFIMIWNCRVRLLLLIFKN